MIKTDLKYVLRRLRRSPGFLLVSCLTLGLAIGATTAVFSVVNGVLLKPLPFPEADRLVGVWHKAPGLGFDKLSQSPALHFSYLDHNRSFDELGMYYSGRVSITGLAEPEQIRAMWVTDRVLPMLGVRPHLGRVFRAEDDAPGMTETAMLAHGYWQERFGGDAAIVGRTVRIEGRPIEVIGVTPANLHFLDYEPDLYLTFQFDRSKVFIGNFSYQGIGRLRDGVTLEEANADVARMLPLAVEQFPMPDGLTFAMMKEAGFGPNLVELREDVVGDVRSVLWVLLGTVGLVLLIACANVSNLFLVRAEAGRRDVAMRSALGANRGDIAGQSLAESLLLSLLGGVVGVGLAMGGLRLLISLSPASLPRLSEIRVDAMMLSFALGLSVLSGLVFGALALVQSGRRSLSSTLREAGRGIGAGRHRLRDLLAVSQVALACVLLIGSGLMMRSLMELRDVDPGFARPEEVLTLAVSIPKAEIENDDAVIRAHESMLASVARLPGVTSVGATSSVTMDGRDSSDPLLVEEFPTSGDELPAIRRFKFVTEGYFATLEIPVLFGRGIEWRDIRDRRSVGVITQNLAREYWDDPSQAIGKRVRESPGASWREIVGVVGDVHDDGVDQEATPVVFWPMAMSRMFGDEEWVQRTLVYAIRSSGRSPDSLLPEVREAIWSQNPNLPVANVRTLQEIVDRTMARTSFTMVMLALAAATAVVLGAVGTYGVVSYTVAQRTREIGVRMALGARRFEVSGMVLRHAGFVAALGITIGLVAALGLTRLMSSLLYGVGTSDPVTFFLTAAGIGLVSLVAGLVPAYRATAINPVEAVRWE